MSAIFTFNLTKEYGDFFALDDLSITIEEGERFAFVGEANCGKTTAIRLLSGLASPTNGECSILGYNPQHDMAKVHEVSGVVLESAKLYGHMTVTENLQFFAKAHNVDSNDAMDRISFLLHKLEAWDYRDEKIQNVPTSVAQKANIARALIHKPKVLLLDEPTDGMNIETTAAVKGLIDHLVEEEGATLLMCTRHHFHAESICDRFAIMQEGVVIARGTIDELRANSGLKSRAVIRIADDSDPPTGFEYNEDGRWYREITSEEEMPQIIARAVSESKVTEAVIEKPHLDSIYEQYVTGKYKDIEEEPKTPITNIGGSDEEIPTRAEGEPLEQADVITEDTQQTIAAEYEKLDAGSEIADILSSAVSQQVDEEQPEYQAEQQAEQTELDL